MKMNVMLIAWWVSWISWWPLSVGKMNLMNNKNAEDDDDDGQPIMRRVFEPHDTWKAFVRHAERTSNIHRKQQRAKNAKGLRKLKGLRGPRGPPGPPGPPGSEFLMTDIKQLVKEATESLVQGLLVDKECANCNDTKLSRPIGAPLFDIDEISIVPKLVWGFHCQMSTNKRIAKKDLQELVGFHTPFASGSFERGEGIGTEQGRFVVPRDAVYHLVANVHLRLKRTKPTSTVSTELKKPKKDGDTLRVLICINTLCKENMALESVVTIGREPWKMTSHVNGHLFLKKGDFVSVLVDNNSSEVVVVERGSYFGGVIVGF